MGGNGGAKQVKYVPDTTGPVDSQGYNTVRITGNFQLYFYE